MRFTQAVLVVAAVLASVLLLPGRDASAAFHCNRIWAVMGGFYNNTGNQYVELRATAGLENFVANHKIRFYNSAGQLKATFTFPGSVGNRTNGDSILIATKEFNDFTVGGDADFVFSDGSPGYPSANTVGSNGGDPKHPIQAPGGKIVFAGEPGDFNCNSTGGIADSLAYGGAAADAGFVSQSASLPIDSNQVLRLGALAVKPSGSATEYGVQPVSVSFFSVAPANLKSNTSTPRNNGRTVLQLISGVGGLAGVPELGRAPLAAGDSAGGMSLGVTVGIAAGAAALAAMFAGGVVLVARRRRIQ